MQEHPVYGILEVGDYKKSPSSVSNDEIQFCKPYTLKHLQNISRIVTPENASHHGYTVVNKEEEFEEEAVIIGPQVKSTFTNKDLVPKVKPTTPNTDHIPFDNVVDISSTEIEEVKQSSERFTSEFMEVLLKQHSPLAMAGEVAQSQLTAVFRDCFDIELEPDLDFENQLDFLSNLDTFCFMLEKQTNIPESIKDVLLKKSIDKMIEDWKLRTRETLKTDGIKRYKQSLENASARMNEEKTNPNIAVRGSRSRG